MNSYFFGQKLYKSLPFVYKKVTNVIFHSKKLESITFSHKKLQIIVISRPCSLVHYVQPVRTL